MLKPVGVARTMRFDSVGISSLLCAQGCESFPSAVTKDSDAPLLQLIVPISGELQLTGDERPVRGNEGALRFTRTDPLQVARECELLVIEAPVELARQVFGPDASTRPLRIEASAPLLAPIVAFATELLNTRRSEQSGLAKYYVERLVQEMLLGLMTDEARVMLAPAAPDPFRQALTIIQARSSDPTLTTDDIAHEVLLSRRQLERLFQKNGTTVATEVRRARVDQALTMLRSPEYARLSVDQIAGLVGFSCGSSLARAMATEGQPSPTSVRTHGSAA